MSPGTTTRPGGSRSSASGGGEGRIVTPEPGHYVEPAFSPDGSLIAYRKTSDGFLTTPLYGQDPGIYVVPAKGGTPKRVAKSGTQPMFGATNDRIFFTADRRGGQAAPEVGDGRTGPRRSPTSSPRMRRDFALSPGRAVRRLDRALPGLCHALRPLRPVDRHRAGRQGIAAVQGQRRRRRLDPLVGRRPQPVLEPGARTFTASTSATSGAFAGGKLAAAPLVAELGVTATPGKPERQHRADRRPDRHHARRRGDREWHRPDRRRPDRRGRADGLDQLPRRNPDHRRQRQDHHARPDRRPLARVDGQRADHPQAELVPRRGARLWRDHRPRPVERHVRDLRRVGISEGRARSSARASSRPAPSSTARPRRSRSRSTASTMRCRTFAGCKASGAWSVKSYNQPRREQRQMIIEAARQLGMEVVPEGGSLFEMNMTMIADGHTTIEHSLPVANIYDDVLQYWKGSGTAYTPTLVVAYGGPFGENYWYQHTNVWAEPILSRWVPRPLIDARSRRPVMNPPEEDNVINISQRGQAGQRPRHPGFDRRPRPARRARRALGHVDVRARRDEQFRGAEDRHDQPGPGARPRPGPRQPRAGQARRPRRARRQSAREYPQLDQHRDDHGRRAAVRFATSRSSPAAAAASSPSGSSEQAGGAFTAGRRWACRTRIKLMPFAVHNDVPVDRQLPQAALRTKRTRR